MRECKEYLLSYANLFRNTNGLPYLMSCMEGEVIYQFLAVHNRENLTSAYLRQPDKGTMANQA